MSNPTTTEQQWTLDGPFVCIKDIGSCLCANPHQAKAIVDAHNASIAAQQIHNAAVQTRNANLEQQLAAESANELREKLRIANIDGLKSDRNNQQLRAQLADKERYIEEIRTTTYSDLEKQLAAARAATSDAFKEGWLRARCDIKAALAKVVKK